MRRVETGEVDATAPDLIWAEVAHTLLRYVRTGAITPENAQLRLLSLLGLPIRLESLAALAPAVLPLALGSGLSGYDAFYLALAQASNAVLVTADRKLAAAASRAEVV
jgi:predicted nucleic acid-binding protein